MPIIFPISFFHRGPTNKRILKFANGDQLEISFRSFYDYLLQGIVYFYQGKVELIGLEGDGISIIKPGIITRFLMQELTLFPGRNVAEANNTYLGNHNFFSDWKMLFKFLFLGLIIKTYELEKSHYSILGVEFSNTSYDEALKCIEKLKSETSPKVISFVNAHCLNISYEQDDYRKILIQSDLILPDGIGIQMGCRLKGFHLKDNVNGTDLFPLLIHQMISTNSSVYLLGGTIEVNNKLNEYLTQNYPKLKITGRHHGHFNHETESDEVIQKINESPSDYLLVAFGVPAQEIWINRYKEKINASVMIGVGGLFDFYSGKNKRAPQWMRELGLEWIYRIYQEPSRMWRRYVIGNPKFILRVLRSNK